MSISKNIRQQVQEVLIKHTSKEHADIESLSADLNSILPTIEPTMTFPNIHQVEEKQPQMVFVSLTVQDILDTEFYYAYLISKPITKDSKVHILKYGLGDSLEENADLDNYEAIMDSRETLVCVTDFYASKWVHEEWKGPAGIEKTVDVKISGSVNCKLGQKLLAVCLWNPTDKYLTYIRPATPEEIQKQRLHYQEQSLKEEINFMEVRQTLQSNLKQFCSGKHAMMVLMSMISQEPMFINSHNISEQLSEILPRVNHVKIKAPFKQSLFPYKNQQGKLIQTPMQMSIANTFTIIDFSEFSNEKQTKIDQAEIDNLKALKTFVEEGKTIYRWEYGESLNEHAHSGLIIKGSRIINPHFYIGQELIEQQKLNHNPFKQMDLGKKEKIRAYIQKCLKIKPILSEESRVKIQSLIKSQIEKFPQKKIMVQETMQLARLHAKSKGNENIDLEDYLFARDLLENENSK